VLIALLSIERLVSSARPVWIRVIRQSRGPRVVARDRAIRVPARQRRSTGLANTRITRERHLTTTMCRNQPSYGRFAINNHSELRGFPRGGSEFDRRRGFYDFCGLRISCAITFRGKREREGEKKSDRENPDRANQPNSGAAVREYLGNADI